MRIALAGNPNSGKTTLFNAITGKIEHVGNWPGVTVEKKEGDVKKKLNKTNHSIRVVDLPGAYSISPFTSEEGVTSAFVRNENPDVIINIIDATNLSRSLLFTTQLLELGIPVIIALNKSDMLERKGIRIDTEMLSEKLGCPVVESSSVSGTGLKELITEAAALIGKGQNPALTVSELPNTKDNNSEVERQRFIFIDELVKEVEIRKTASNIQTKQDAVDRILTHRIWGIPIFAVVIYLVFSISQSYLGPLLADTFVG